MKPLITLRPKPLKRPPTRPRRRSPRTIKNTDFQPLLSKFPTLDLSWSPDVQAAWFRTYAALKRQADELDAQQK